MLKITIVPPAGKFNKKARTIPQITDKIEKQAEAIMVFLKLMDSCKAVRGGKISIAETSIMPATFMAKTAATAVNRKRSTLILFVLMPIVWASSSSKVIAKKSL